MARHRLVSLLCGVLAALAQGSGRDGTTSLQPVPLLDKCVVIGGRFSLAMRGGGEGGGDSAVAPARAADLTKTVRIGGSNVNATKLASSYGARRANGAARVPSDRSERMTPRRGRVDGHMPQGQRPEKWTQTEVVQAPSRAGSGLAWGGGSETFVSRKLFLGGTGSLLEKDMYEYLESQFGELADVEVIRHYDQPRGFAFVTFVDSNAAAQCLGAGSFSLKGHSVHVSPCDKEAGQRRLRKPKFELTGVQTAGNKVFLGGTRQLTEGALLPALQRFGEVTHLHVHSRPENMLQLAGYAFATFRTCAEAQRLVNRGFITTANVTLEARLADDNSRPGVSEKVNLGDVDELVTALEEEIARVATFAPGGFKHTPAAQHQGIVFAMGTPHERTVSQHMPATDEAMDEHGRTVTDLARLLEDAQALRTQVWDCLCSRVRAAAQRNDVALIDKLVALGASVNAPQRELAASLAESAATLGCYDEQAPRALYLAARAGQVDACCALLGHGADLDAVCHGDELQALGSFVGYTPLKAAAERGFVDVVEVLLQRGADANFSDESRWTILHWAACNNHADVVRALVAAGADMNALTMQGRSPLNLALTALASASAQVLQDLGAVDISRRKKAPLNKSVGD